MNFKNPNRFPSAAGPERAGRKDLPVECLGDEAGGRMKNERPTLRDDFFIIGEITEEALCFSPLNGAVRRLRKDTPPIQRARFFEELFDDPSFAGDLVVRASPAVGPTRIAV